MVVVATSSTSSRATLNIPPWVQALLLTMITLVLLWPSMNASFIWDDQQQIVTSPTIADPDAPGRYFFLNVVESWGEEGRGAEGVDTYRPLFFIALWSIHHINGADPFWFHMAVVVSHLAVCLLLWTAARRWIGSDLAAAGIFIAFAVHPVTAEAYLWASAISESMATAGFLVAVLILDRWCRDERPSWIAVTLAGLVLLLGLLSKEAVVTALPIVSIYLWRVRGVRVRALVGLWIAVVVFLSLRVFELSGLQATGSGTDQRLEAIRNLPVLILDSLWALVTLQPVGIRHLYWDYHETDWTTSLIAAAVVLALCAAAWLVRRQAPLFPTAFGVLICMLVPIALITTVPGWSGFGRYLYLPWGFITLGAAEAIRRFQPVLREAAPRLQWAAGIVVIVFIVLEILGLRSAHHIYHSQENLARASVELQPHAPDGWEWLGNLMIENGDLGNAARCYAEAVAIEPSIYRPRHNLAAALYYLGQPAEALEHERAIASIYGITTESAVVAASACIDLERWEEAKRWIEAGLQREPTNERLLQLGSSLSNKRPEPPV